MQDAVSPPAFVQLAAHELRWRLLRELARSDRAVRELTDLLDEPQNLVSYHLAKLRTGGLVSARRSTADGRDTYYAIDLAACQRELHAAGAGLHPGLSVTPATAAVPRARRTRVLFLCTGNSARSQIAAALLERMSAGTIDALSAGSHPKALHPSAVRVMRRRGIDISGNRTRHVDEYLRQRFDMVITLCDRVREVCPEFPSHPELAHWSIPDPAREGAGKDAFEQTAAELEIRIRYLLAVLQGRPTHAKRRDRQRPLHGQRRR